MINSAQSGAGATAARPFPHCATLHAGYEPVWASSASRSKIRLVGLRDREQVLMVVILVVLGAGGFQHRVGHLAPGLAQMQRLVESVGIIDHHRGFERLAVGR